MLLQFPGEGPQIPFFQQRANPLVGQVQLLQAAQQKDLLNLAVLIVAVAVLLYPDRRLEKPLLVIVSQLFGGDIAEVGHLPHRISRPLHPISPHALPTGSGVVFKPYYCILPNLLKNVHPFHFKTFPFLEGLFRRIFPHSPHIFLIAP